MTPAQLDAYIEKNELDTAVDFSENARYKSAPTDTISGKLEIPFPPEKQDLVRLHKLIRLRKPFTVLEFGVGYSTAIIALALWQNKQEWEQLRRKPFLRNRYAFQHFCLDASKKWIQKTKDRLPANLLPFVNFYYSEVSIGLHQGQLCHFYDHLPDIVPDFIYVDAPDTKQVKGEIHGLSFACDERTVMAADVLLMESTLLPGTFILIDGRTNNARFLARHLQRPFKVAWDKKNDVTTLELIEEKLGKYNLIGREVY